MSKEVDALIMDVLAPLGADLARDIIAHRKGLKCPLTVRGAKGLMKEYLMAGDPVQAAEYHLNQGWRGFDHTWMRKPQGRAQGHKTPQHLGNMADFTRDLMDRYHERQNQIPAGAGRSIEHFVEDASGPIKRPVWDA